MKLIILLINLYSLQKLKLDQESHVQFQNWADQHEKTFENSADYLYRMKIYQDTDAKIQKHNESGSSFKMGHNQFSHLTDEEFMKQVTMNIKLSERQSEPTLEAEYDNLKDLPDQVDYRTNGHVLPIRNQGMCGSCYAFAALDVYSTVESIRGQKLKTYSPQYVVNCGPQFHPALRGCGGEINNTQLMKFLQQIGFPEESDVPYQGKDGRCYPLPASSLNRINDFREISGDRRKLLAKLAQHPLVLFIQVIAGIWKQYSEGIVDFKGPCGISNNHAVSIIGYDLTGDKDYIIVRNQWGASWGEGGYIRLALHDTPTGMCGIYNGDNVYEIY